VLRFYADRNDPLLQGAPGIPHLHGRSGHRPRFEHRGGVERAAGNAGSTS
jgi:hypothetical protein